MSLLAKVSRWFHWPYAALVVRLGEPIIVTHWRQVASVFGGHDVASHARRRVVGVLADDC